MLGRLRSSLSVARLATLLALSVVLAGGSIAAGAIGGGGPIKECYAKKGGAVRVLAKGRCAKRERAFSFDSRGAQGVVGATTSATTTRAPGTTWAARSRPARTTSGAGGQIVSPVATVSWK